MQRRFVLVYAVICGLLTASFPFLAQAQTAPDAGRLLQEQPKPPVPQAPARKPPAAEQPAAPAGDAGPRILVNGVRISGATLIPEAELAAQLKGIIGRELSFSQLRAASLLLIGYYAERGYLARVILPEQEIKGGVVEFRVVEGIRGNVNVKREGERIDAARVQAFIENRLPAGAPMSIEALGEALNILNDQPGTQVNVTLSPGKDPRVSDLNVNAEDTPLTSLSLAVNNHASRGSGVWQTTGILSLNNPTGRFDSATFLLNVSEGSHFGRADYSLALGNSGLRLGVNASYLEYRLVQQSFSALSSKGNAETYGVNASYPLVRLAARTINLTANADHKRLVDETVAGETGNRLVRVASVGVNGFEVLPSLSLVMSYGLNFTSGDSDQRNAGALAADQAGRRTQGGFSKWSYNLGAFYNVAQNWTLNAAMRGQLANDNLDSSERFGLGGINGVRAYPTGEAFGDEGWLLNLNLQRRLSDQLSATAFLDSGQITVNHTLPPGGTVTPNRYTLSGGGVALNWQVRDNTSLGLTLAAPIGNNPGRDANGRNSDGRKNNPRLWASLALRF